MNQKRFFTLAALILLIMVGFFTAELLSMYNNNCTPNVGGGCLQEWESYCYSQYGGDHVGWVYLQGTGTCYVGDCMGFYDVLCDNGELKVFRDACVDSNNWKCSEN